LLGHKSIKNTVKYTRLVHFKDDEFDVATTTVEEAKELSATGFELLHHNEGMETVRCHRLVPGAGFLLCDSNLRPTAISSPFV